MNLVDLNDLMRVPILAFLGWLCHLGLIHEPVCETCRETMELKEREGSHIDGYLRQCRTCKKRRNLRANSFFELFPKTSLKTLIHILYLWSVQELQTKAAEMLQVTPQLVGRVYKEVRLLCSRDIIETPFYPFGGPNQVCKCDESKFQHKRKANRGRFPRHSSWVFGVITISTDSSPCKGYYQVVNRRNRAALSRIIQRVLLPGSELHTDDWAGYANISQYAPNVARHRVVVHADNFVDPTTGVHTQEIESAWARLKYKIKSKKGVKQQNLQSFLDEQMWLDFRSEGQTFENFAQVIARYYANHPL